MFRQKKLLRIVAGGNFFLGVVLALILAVSGGGFLYQGLWPLILVPLAVSSILGGLIMMGLVGKRLTAVPVSGQQRYQPQQEVPEVFQKEFARYL